MIAAVIEGQFKSPESLQKAINTEWLMVKATKFFTNCRGGILITKPDGNFMDISLWDTEEEARKIMENTLVKTVVKVFETELVKPYNIRYFNVAINLNMDSGPACKDFRILYFSGTGNTHWVVNKIREGLTKTNCSCEVIDAERLHLECGRGRGKDSHKELLREKLSQFIPEGITLIFAFPVHASDIPQPLRELIPFLPKGGGRKLASVATMLMAGGDAVLQPEELMKGMGYESVIAEYVLMPNNIKIPAFNFFEIKNGEDLNSYYATAAKKIDEITQHLLTGKKRFEGKGIGGYLLGVSQRVGEGTLKNYLPNNLFAHAKCIKCGLCAATCPMANISLDRGFPEFGKNCCICLRCYNFCPVNAINVTSQTLDEEKYPRYKGFDGWKPPILRQVEVKT